MRKILIVDDDQKTRVLLKTYLEKNQYEVILSHNGESFLAELHAHGDELSLVILDVMLPDTDGFALCKQVRQRSNVAIIMLTASSDETDRIVGLNWAPTTTSPSHTARASCWRASRPSCAAARPSRHRRAITGLSVSPWT